MLHAIDESHAYSEFLLHVPDLPRNVAKCGFHREASARAASPQPCLPNGDATQKLDKSMVGFQFCGQHARLLDIT
jgi:hypothetical protein